MAVKRSNVADAPRHPVGVVAERLGVSADVLRAWERRYGAVEPARGEGGHRLYSDDDVRRLTLVSKLVRNGRGPSQVAGLSLTALERLVAEDARGLASREESSGAHHARALAAARALDSQAFTQTLRCSLLSLGTPAFLESVLAPLIVDIGEDWHDGRMTIAHEHAATAAIEHLLAWLMREFTVTGNAPRVLLATPSGERHALGGMIAASMAAHDAWSVTWLGPDVPSEAIARAAAANDVHVVGISTVVGRPAATRSSLKELRRDVPDGIPILVGGAASAVARDVAGVTAVRDLTHWRELLRRHSPAAPAGSTATA